MFLFFIPCSCNSPLIILLPYLSKDQELKIIDLFSYTLTKLMDFFKTYCTIVKSIVSIHQEMNSHDYRHPKRN